jgi:hypothetical protein
LSSLKAELAAGLLRLSALTRCFLRRQDQKTKTAASSAIAPNDTPTPSPTLVELDKPLLVVAGSGVEVGVMMAEVVVEDSVEDDVVDPDVLETLDDEVLFARPVTTPSWSKKTPDLSAQQLGSLSQQ